jgi:hypothetical protein
MLVSRSRSVLSRYKTPLTKEIFGLMEKADRKKEQVRQESKLVGGVSDEREGNSGSMAPKSNANLE